MAMVMLGDTTTLNAIAPKIGGGRTTFQEDGHIVPPWLSMAGIPLFGKSGSESSYWQNMRDNSNSRDVRDPYGYIDGGRKPGRSYQFCCTSQPYKAIRLAVEWLPRVKTAWNNTAFLDYIDRWVKNGSHASPDPCAPMVGTCSGGSQAGSPCTSSSTACTAGGGDCMAPRNDPNYGVLYGPDGNGSCILDTDPSDGTGRRPQYHHDNAGLLTFLLHYW